MVTMTLVLVGSKPNPLGVKTFGFGPMGRVVYLGDYEVSLEDFLAAAGYVLTNTDLEPEDPRLQFVEFVRFMRRVDGYNPGQKRLESPEPVLPP